MYLEFLPEAFAAAGVFEGFRLAFKTINPGLTGLPVGHTAPDFRPGRMSKHEKLQSWF